MRDETRLLSAVMIPVREFGYYRAQGQRVAAPGGKKRILSKCRSLFMWDIGLLCAVQCKTAGADSSEEYEHSPLYEKRVPVKMATLRTTARLG